MSGSGGALSASSEKVEDFRARIAAHLGLQFEDSRCDFLADVLRSRLSEGGYRDAESYLPFLERRDALREWRILAEALTVSETYFFRNGDHFRALNEAVLPELFATRGPRGLRFLSAGCASGEEAYSLAMAAGLQSGVRIQAVDINPAVLAKAKAGQYSAWALRDTPPATVERYFVRQGNVFRLHPDVLAAVSFEERNLAEPNDDLWEGGPFDLIFCRNMLMYMVPETAARLVSRMADALAPGGYLFLGHAETMRGLSNAFQLRHTHDTFYYRKPPDGPSANRPSSFRQDGIFREETAWGMALPEEGPAAWMDVIRKASDRIAGLAARSDPAPPAAPKADAAAAIPAAPGRGLGDTLDLLRKERYGEAMEALRRVPPGAVEDPEALLLEAVLLINMDRREEAERACGRLLALDGLNAGAHYVTALCREQAGDAAAAEEHDKTALYLDAAFAMPWLHLGLLARRQGRGGEALRHFEHALALLAREDSSRILLFGGGFGREALMRLCRNGMAAAQGGVGGGGTA